MNEIWQQKIFQVGGFVLTVGKLAAVIFLIMITWIGLLLFKKYLIHRKEKVRGERSRRLSVLQLTRYFVWVLVISFCVNILELDVTLLVAGSAALLVGIGFGLQNIFSDLISGLFMLFERKVKVGDVMEVDSIVGKVKAINLRTSELLTRDGYNIIVPNHKFITDNVVNWSHNSYDRRFEIQVGVSYGSDVNLVTELLLQCALTQKELIKENEHKPHVRFLDFGDSSLVFLLMFWTSDIFPVEQIKSELRYKIFQAFTDNKVVIPFPQRDVHIFNTDK
ncbi:MAG: mechanosensitive ion channel [Chitinophagaceae bacterium]|nr:mechanosensitive ion channel [Chitinophagaceae bacterium]